MKKLGVVLGAWVVLMMSALDGTAQTSPPVDPDGPMPVAEFNAAVPADPAEAAIRAARNQRFSLDYFGPITDAFGDAVLSTHPRRRSDKDLVHEADTIVEATALTASAYIAQNRKVVYSEFRLRVEGMLKDRALSHEQVSLAPGDVITGLRAGGAVRFPSGEISKQVWDGQHMPIIGSTYMLFLRREPAIEAFTIITGYAIKESEVQALDDVYYFPRRAGMAVELFRREIRTLVEQAGRRAARGRAAGRGCRRRRASSGAPAASIPRPWPRRNARLTGCSTATSRRSATRPAREAARKHA